MWLLLTRCCLHLRRYQQDKQKAAQAAVEMKRSLHQQLHAVEVRKQAEAALEQQVGSGACFQGANACCTVPAQWVQAFCPAKSSGAGMQQG